MQDVGIDEKCL